MVAAQVHGPRLGLIPLTLGLLAVNVLNKVSLLDLLCLKGLKIRVLRGVTGQYYGVKAHLRTPIWEPCQFQSSSWAQFRLLLPFHYSSTCPAFQSLFLYLTPYRCWSWVPYSPKYACLKIFISKSASQGTWLETYSVMVKRMGSRIRPLGFESWAYHFRAVFLCSSYSLNLFNQVFKK